MDKIDQAAELRERTKHFALRAIRRYQNLPRTGEAQIIGKQLLRLATSVAANYRAACCGRSNAEFYGKLCVVVAEADETIFWIELLQDSEILEPKRLEGLFQVALEISKIMSEACKTAGENR